VGLETFRLLRLLCSQVTRKQRCAALLRSGHEGGPNGPLVQFNSGSDTLNRRSYTASPQQSSCRSSAKRRGLETNLILRCN
jgi:hypothetical protein